MLSPYDNIVKVNKIEEEDVTYWQGLDVHGREVEYKSKRLHIKKKYDDLNNIIEMYINGELICSKEVSESRKCVG